MIDFEGFLKDAPQYKYNVNIYTKAKLAESDEQLEKDTKLVDNLGTFIMDTVIPKVVQDLTNSENIPTDCESTSQLFHSHGLNIRYLGKVLSTIEEGKFPHVRLLLERNIVARSCKHLVQQLLQKADPENISLLVSHLLNVLLAPFYQLDKLNTGKIALTPKQEVTPPPKSESEEVPAQQKESKRQKKKRKQKEK